MESQREEHMESGAGGMMGTLGSSRDTLGGPPTQ